MQEIKDKLQERVDHISQKGYQSKERILLDEDLKAKFDVCEADLKDLRAVFKTYQDKNKRKLEQFELE